MFKMAQLTDSQRVYRNARNQAVISILIFSCSLIVASPNLTSAASGSSQVFVGTVIDGQRAMSIKAYGLDGNQNTLALKSTTWQKVPDGNPDMTVFVRPTSGADGVYRTSDATKGTVQYKFQVLNPSGQLSDVYKYNQAYIYYSPRSVFETYLKLKQEYQRRQVLLDKNTATDTSGMTEKQHYLSAMSWCEAYLTECLGQDGTRVWQDFSSDPYSSKAGSIAYADANLKGKYSPIQFHMMPESEDVYRFPIIRDGNESLFGAGYDPLHKKALSSGQTGFATGGSGYYTYLTISDSPLVSADVYRGYKSGSENNGSAPVEIPRFSDANYYAVPSNAVWQVTHGNISGVQSDIAGKTQVKTVQTDLANQTYSLISEEAYQQTVNPATAWWVGVRQWFHSFLGGGDYLQDANVDKNIIGWAWSDKTDNNIRKVDVKDAANDPNMFITATVMNRSIYTGDKTLQRVKMLQEPQYAGMMPYPQTYYTDLQQGVEKFQRFQGFELDVAASSISMANMLDGLDINGYWAKSVRDAANYVLSWASPAMVNLLSSGNNFNDTGDQWMNRLVRGLNSGAVTQDGLTAAAPDFSADGNQSTLGGYFRKSQNMAQVLLILFILWTVLKVLTSDWSGNQVESITELRDMIPRAFFAAIMIGINGKGGGVVLASMVWWVNDVVCSALLDQQAISTFFTLFPASTVASPSWIETLSTGLMALVMGLGYIVVIVIYMMRAIGIWVLVLFMPWAWMCSITKTTQKFTQTWIGMWVGTIGIQFLHAIMLLGFISILNTQELADITMGSVIAGVDSGSVAAAVVTSDGISTMSQTRPIGMLLMGCVMLFMMFKVSQSVFSQAMFSGRGAVAMAGGMAKAAAISYPLRRMMRSAMSGSGLRNAARSMGRNVTGRQTPARASAPDRGNVGIGGRVERNHVNQRGSAPKSQPTNARSNRTAWSRPTDVRSPFGQQEHRGRSIAMGRVAGTAGNPIDVARGLTQSYRESYQQRFGAQQPLNDRERAGSFDISRQPMFSATAQLSGADGYAQDIHAAGQTAGAVRQFSDAANSRQEIVGRAASLQAQISAPAKHIDGWAEMPAEAQAAHLERINGALVSDIQTVRRMDVDRSAAKELAAHVNEMPDELKNVINGGLVTDRYQAGLVQSYKQSHDGQVVEWQKAEQELPEDELTVIRKSAADKVTDTPMDKLLQEVGSKASSIITDAMNDYLLLDTQSIALDGD